MIVPTESPGQQPLLDGLLVLREQKKMLDASWLMTLVVLFIAIAVPWFLRVLDLRFSVVAWSVFGFGAAYTAGALSLDRVSSRSGLLAGMAILQAAGIVFLGWLWLAIGGAQVPAFLLVFVLPIVTSGFMMLNWQPYAAAALSFVVVAIATLITAPSLQWYLNHVGLPIGWLLERLPDRYPASGISVTPASAIVLLDFFGVLTFATAVTTESVASFLLRLMNRARATSEAVTRAETLYQQVLRVNTNPVALVYPDNCQIVEVSDSFRRHLLVGDVDLHEKSLFDLVAFAYPEVVRDAIARAGGEVPFAVFRLGPETRVARVATEPIQVDETEYVYITLHDVSDQYFLKTAMDATDDAHIVVGGDRRIVLFNRRARDLSPAIEVGADAMTALQFDGLPAAWWDPGPRWKHQRKIAFDGAERTVSLTTLEVPGQVNRFIVVSVRGA